MDLGKVSIVVPIYNVEKYVDRCIESIINQTYSNLEIILVDDGSPDSCPQKCESWAKKDTRIKVIHKKNEGLGMARNTGIDNATGEYIYFVDSDDYIALNTIEKCYTFSKEKNTDVVTFGYSKVWKNGKIGKPNIPSMSKQIFEGTDVQNEFLPNLIAPDVQNGIYSNLWMSACALFCKLKVIQDAKWKFASEREVISEDIYSIMELYYYIKKVGVIEESFYYYCENEVSLTHTYREDRYFKIKEFYDKSVMLCNSLEYPTIVEQRLSYQYLSNTIAAFKMVVKSENNGNSQKKRIIKAIVTDPHLQRICYNINNNREKSQRKFLIFCIRKKWANIVYFLIKIKN